MAKNTPAPPQKLRVVIDKQEFLVNGLLEIFHNTGEDGPNGGERLVARYNVKEDRFEVAENSTGAGATGALAMKAEFGKSPEQATLVNSGGAVAAVPSVSASPAPAPLHNMQSPSGMPMPQGQSAVPGVGAANPTSQPGTQQ